jgi:hypothetical protein
MSAIGVMPANAALKLVRPTNEKRTVPIRKRNSEYRTREHLTEREVEKLVDGAKGNRHGHRDSTMVLMPLGTAYVRQNWLTYAGTRWT